MDCGQYQGDFTEMVKEQDNSNLEPENNDQIIVEKPSGEIYQSDKEPFPELYEETSYHELRCLSNDDFNNSITHFTSIQSTECENIEQSFNNECCTKFYSYPENCITSRSSENTDDQLFIEVIKDTKSGVDEDVSLFDSISFNIEDDDEIFTEIKIIDDGSSLNDPSQFLFVTNTRNTDEDIPHVVRLKKRERKRERKPMGLANYRNLITEAINSSPEKRMILTDIYKWVMAKVPFFREKDDSWKNCIRHTLSVNEKFMRVKNNTNIRTSYWTVCEEGEFHTKFAKIPWASEIYKPEERKRKPKIKVVNKDVNKGENALKLTNNTKNDKKTSDKSIIDRKNGVVSVKVTNQSTSTNKSTDEINKVRNFRPNKNTLKTKGRKKQATTSQMLNGKTQKVNKIKNGLISSTIPSPTSMTTRRKQALAKKEELKIKAKKSKLKNIARDIDNREKAQSNKRRKKTAKSQAINKENVRRSKRRKNVRKGWKF